MNRAVGTGRQWTFFGFDGELSNLEAQIQNSVVTRKLFLGDKITFEFFFNFNRAFKMSLLVSLRRFVLTHSKPLFSLKMILIVATLLTQAYIFVVRCFLVGWQLGRGMRAKWSEGCIVGPSLSQIFASQEAVWTYKQVSLGQTRPR